MSTTDRKDDPAPLELDESPRVQGTMADDLDLLEPPHGLRAWLPWILGGLAFAAVIALLLLAEGGINHFVHRFRTNERKAEQGEVVYGAGSKDVVPGVIFVDSHPPGALVRVNGVKIGYTPVIVQRRLTGRTAEVRLDADGRKSWMRRVPVVHGGIHVEAKLEK